MGRQEHEWLGFLEVCGLVAAEVGIPVEGEFADARTGLEVDLIELDPDQAGAEDILEKVDLVLLVRNRAPDGRRDVGLARRADPARDAHVAHHAEDGRDGLARLDGLLGGVDVDPTAMPC